MAKLPSLEHVKYVRRKTMRGEKVYAYFNTGKMVNGKIVYAPMPHPASVGFYDTYSALKAGRTKRQATAYTVAALAAEYTASAAYASKAKATQDIYRHQLSRACVLLGEYPVNDLHPQDVRTILDGEQWGNATRNAFVSAIGALYQWGRKRGKTTLWPTKDIERDETGTHPPWPSDALATGLASPDDTTRLAVTLLYFTGARIGDVCSLRWSVIEDRVLTLTPEKTKRTGKTLHIPLHYQLADELDRTPKRGLTILTDKDGRPLKVRQLRDILQKAFPGTRPHGLRKNAVNALLEAGCTIAEVAAITGQTHAMVEHYAQAVDQRRLARAAVLKFEGREKSA